MPSELVSAVVDNDLTPLAPDRSLLDVASYLAAYNLLSAPVVDDAGRLVGAVTVDDVLDHLLPPGWRDTRDPDDPDRLPKPVTGRGRSALCPLPRPGTSSGGGLMARDDRTESLERPQVRRRDRYFTRRVDQPKLPGRQLITMPHPDLLGSFSERFARFMGTAAFLTWMTAIIVLWVLWNTVGPDRTALRRLPVHLPHAVPVAPGQLRRTADPARAEPAGGTGPRAVRVRPRRPAAHSGRHGVPGPGGGVAAPVGGRDRHPRLPALGIAFPAYGSEQRDGIESSSSVLVQATPSRRSTRQLRRVARRGPLVCPERGCQTRAVGRSPEPAR